jgi:hypothetical protein
MTVKALEDLTPEPDFLAGQTPVANVQHEAVGCIVHFWGSAGQKEPMAAIVSETDDGPHRSCALTVFDPTKGPRLALGVRYGEQYERGPRWCWPPRT